MDFSMIEVECVEVGMSIDEDENVDVLFVLILLQCVM
jgi:hypothetical protein